MDKCEPVCCSNFKLLFKNESVDLSSIGNLATRVDFDGTSVKVVFDVVESNGFMQPYPQIKQVMDTATETSIEFTLLNKTGNVLLKRTAVIQNWILGGMSSFDYSNEEPAQIILFLSLKNLKEEYQ